jgi:hypothetical protein
MEEKYEYIRIDLLNLFRPMCYLQTAPSAQIRAWHNKLLVRGLRKGVA